MARKKGDGVCFRCWTSSPTRPVTQAENLMATLAGNPEWLARFAEFATERHCVDRACLMVSAIGRLVTDGGPLHPQAILERSRRPGRSAGTLARTLEEFLVSEHLAFGLDQQARLAHGRRQRRVDATPTTFRPAVQSFADHLVSSRQRARRAGTRPRADNTIEQTLSITRDLAKFLTDDRDKNDWATVDVGDIEAFLGQHGANRRRRLHVARQFFRWARKHKLVLVDPTRDLPGMPRSGFTGRTLSLTEQRRLFRRWTTDPHVHPHEALVGLLALLHAASNLELRNLCVDDYDPARQTLRVGHRPRPVPLDPVSVTVVQRCLAHRESLPTLNPHLIVTAQTKTRSTPASSAYMTHLLDPAGAAAKHLRSTRILDLVVTLDPKVVGEALGMRSEGLVDYLADHVDAGRLTATN
ncbi:MAG: integrase [Actinomycetota bacterium]|nr:integrase [Actinomycetota bacterium]